MNINKIIIENVKRHECLYNLASSDYKNAHKKNIIWQEIGVLANLSGEECKKRWKGLRDTFQRRKREAQLAFRSGGPRPPKYKYMKALAFLNNYKDSRLTIGRANEKTKDSSYYYDSWTSTFTNEYMSEDESTSEQNVAEIKSNFNEIIIENVRKHECLYNAASSDYKNVQKKTILWEEIGDLANLSGEACKRRWKGLRDTYKRRKREAQLASYRGLPSPPMKWKYMQALEFLNDDKDSRFDNRTIGSGEEQINEIPYVANELISEDESNLAENAAQPQKYTQKHQDAETISMLKEVKKECANSVKQSKKHTDAEITSSFKEIARNESVRDSKRKRTDTEITSSFKEITRNESFRDSKRKHTDAEITSCFKEIARNESDRDFTRMHTDAELTSSFKEIARNESVRDSTSLLFESLAKKILESNLPKSVVSKIEAKIVNMVYKEIAQHLK